MRNWTMFWITIGFLLIATSPMLPNPYLNIIMGFTIVVIGGIRLWRKNRK